MARKSSAAKREPAPATQVPESEWRPAFLAHLAATSNVSASARKAQVEPARIYALRRRDPQFYQEWQEALCQGYDALEFNLLCRLREGESKPSGKRSGRSFDNATALRLLSAHRESAARQRALVEAASPDDVLHAINAKIERMQAPDDGDAHEATDSASDAPSNHAGAV